jgi:hypothetical protein
MQWTARHSSSALSHTVTTSFQHLARKWSSVVSARPLKSMLNSTRAEMASECTFVGVPVVAISMC